MRAGYAATPQLAAGVVKQIHRPGPSLPSAQVHGIRVGYAPTTPSPVGAKIIRPTPPGVQFATTHDGTTQRNQRWRQSFLRHTHQHHHRLLGKKRTQPGHPPKRLLRSHHRRLLSYVWNTYRRHDHLLGQQLLRPNRCACRTVQRRQRRKQSFVWDPHRHHHHLLGRQLLWPDRCACRTVQRRQRRRLPFLCTRHQRNRHLLGQQRTRPDR